MSHFQHLSIKERKNTKTISRKESGGSADIVFLYPFSSF